MSVQEGEVCVWYAVSDLGVVKFEVQERSVDSSGNLSEWKNSFNKPSAEGSFEINGKQESKYRLGPVQQVHGEEVALLKSSMESRGL